MQVDENTEKSLVFAAIDVLQNSYSPYSRFKVGAAVLGESGKIYSGSNIENASFGLTICAERSAIFNGVSAGERKFVALAVVADGEAYPCGACRQVFAEFADDDAIIIIADPQGSIIDTTTLGKFLPKAFRLKK